MLNKITENFRTGEILDSGISRNNYMREHVCKTGAEERQQKPLPTQSLLCLWDSVIDHKPLSIDLGIADTL